MKILVKYNGDFLLLTMYPSGNWRKRDIFTAKAEYISVSDVEKIVKKGCVIHAKS